MIYDWADSALPAKLWQKAQQHGPVLAAVLPIKMPELTLLDGHAKRPDDIVCRALVYQARWLVDRAHDFPSLRVNEAGVVYWHPHAHPEDPAINAEKELTWSL